MISLSTSTWYAAEISQAVHHIICTQDEWLLSKEVVADLKEVFMLFDKDEEPCFSKYHIKLKRLVSTLETQFKCFEGSNFWSIQKSTSVP